MEVEGAATLMALFSAQSDEGPAGTASGQTRPVPSRNVQAGGSSAAPRPVTKRMRRPSASLVEAPAATKKLRANDPVGGVAHAHARAHRPAQWGGFHHLVRLHDATLATPMCFSSVLAGLATATLHSSYIIQAHTPSRSPRKFSARYSGRGGGGGGVLTAVHLCCRRAFSRPSLSFLIPTTAAAALPPPPPRHRSSASTSPSFTP
eukprot:COSAG05_NODE_5173_length_1245_cov_1.040140_1_plen_204_part_10